MYIIYIYIYTYIHIYIYAEQIIKEVPVYIKVDPIEWEARHGLKAGVAVQSTVHMSRCKHNGQTLVKRWSSFGGSLVKKWQKTGQKGSKTGQMLSKYWSSLPSPLAQVQASSGHALVKQ